MPLAHHHTDLLAIGAAVGWPDEAVQDRVRRQLAPASASGRLVELACWLAAARARPDHDQAGTAPAPAAPRIRALLFTAPTPYRLDLDELADQVGVTVRRVDAAATNTNTTNTGTTITATTDITSAIAAGAAAADAEVDAGTDIVLLAYPGDRVAATAVIAALCDVEPVALLARGAAATNPERWMRHALAVRDLRRRLARVRTDAIDVLAAAGSPVLASLCAFVLQAAARRTPLVLDGLAAVAAAVAAQQIQSLSVRWCLVADSSNDPAIERGQRQLGLTPLLALGTSSGDGTAAVLTAPVLRAADALARTTTRLAAP